MPNRISSVPSPAKPVLSSAISALKFPFKLTNDQLEAVDAWVLNGNKGLIIYSTGTGKTEIAFECARRAAAANSIVSSENNNIKNNKNKNCNASSQDSITTIYRPFNILYLVPRIVLVDQNIKRLIKYGISKQHIGAYFGERKEVREITISTYQSVITNPTLIHGSDMVIFDEVHLVSNTAARLRNIFDIVKRTSLHERQPSLLGLTATIDEDDPKYTTILSLLPPVRKYMIKEAVKDQRLAKPVIIPIKVMLTHEERKIYDECSIKIRNISGYLNTSDPKSISSLLWKGGYKAGLARAWFANVKKRKSLVNCAENKLLAAIDLIVTKHPSERIMVFSETIESIQKLKEMLLQNKGIKSMVIDSKLKSNERQKILSEWGRAFFPLLSVHTLEIGYDVPEVRVAIILATTSNMNQIVQRIGRVVRKTAGKVTALIYAIYLSYTRDASTLKLIRQATDLGKESRKKRPKSAKNMSEVTLPTKRVFDNHGSLDKYIF